MKKKVIETRSFKREVDSFISKNKLLSEDFESFKRELALNPDKGDLVPGTGGLRKIRLKSASKGKSGGFRVCYFDDSFSNSIFLLWIYSKNDQENITNQDKKAFKDIINKIKARNYE